MKSTMIDPESIMDSLTRNDWDHLHDMVFDVTGRSPSREELYAIFLEMPERLQSSSILYGMSDTPWRDDFLAWFKDRLSSNGMQTDFPALWQVRWTNPAKDRHPPPSLLRWEIVSPGPSQTLQNKINELTSYVSSNGIRQYEVRALYDHSPEISRKLFRLLMQIEQLGNNPSDLAPELIGDPDRWQKLCSELTSIASQCYTVWPEGAGLKPKT